MILSRAGRGYTKPPPGARVNWGHPLARGLAWAYLMNEGAGRARDLVSGKFGQASEDNSTLWDVWRSGPRGLANTFPGTYPNYWDTTLKGPAYDNKRVMTIASFVRFDADALSQPLVGKSGVQLTIVAGTSAIRIWQDTTGSYPLADSSSLDTTVWHSVVGVLYGSGTAPLLYVDGSLNVASSGVGSGTDGDNSAFSWIISANSGGAPREIGYVMVWNRALTPSEIVWVSAEPFAFLLAQSPSVKYFLPAASGVIYPQLERGVRGLNRGVYEGAYR